MSSPVDTSRCSEPIRALNSSQRARDWGSTLNQRCFNVKVEVQCYTHARRLRNADMWRWGLSKSSAYYCREQTSRQQITSSQSSPFIVHQMVSMAWLMLMQMQQLDSGYSASSQRSNYFFSFHFFFWFHTQEEGSMLNQRLFDVESQPREIENILTGGNWQKWKRVFLTCPCHEIYRDEAVGLKSYKNTWKITIFVKMWNLGQYRENLIFCQ